jgi:hypothetical protein
MLLLETIAFAVITLAVIARYSNDYVRGIDGLESLGSILLVIFYIYVGTAVVLGTIALINRSVFKRLAMRPPEPGPRRVTLHTQENGIIYYEARLFEEPYLDKIPHQLLASGLDWYWQSARDHETHEEFIRPNLPKERPFTKLTEQNQVTLMDDLTERNIDGDLRYTVLLGVDPNTSIADLIGTEWSQTGKPSAIGKQDRFALL